MRFKRNTKRTRSGGTHVSYTNEAAGILIEQYGIGWAIYLGNVYRDAYGKLADAKAAAAALVGKYAK